VRILYVSQYFPPEPGAPAARVSELARAWVRAGHEVTVLTGLPHHPTGIVPLEYRGQAHVEEDFHGVRVVRTWIYAAANQGKIRRSLAYASFAASAALFGQLFVGTKPDVLVATSPQLLCGAAGAVIAAARRVPFVLEIRDLWPESIVAVGALPARHPVIRGLTALEESLYRAAEKIVVVTDAFRERLVERGIARDKLAVIKNGVDLSRFAPMTRETPLRERLGLGDRFVAAYVGTHGMAHGLDAVLDVAQRFLADDGVRFVFVGEGAERQRLEARARRDGLTNVQFLGVLPRERMTEVYATSDVCLVPLRKSELFSTVIPSKIFEILAMERPLVLSVDGEARQIVEASGGGIYAPPEDVTAMADAIDALRRDPARAASMGRAGREYVVREFDREHLAGAYLDVLRGVLGESDGGIKREIDGESGGESHGARDGGEAHAADGARA
jgi:glycosyltransferase involved in cell wall biosynthesis